MLQTVERPAHVPEALFFDFDIWSMPPAFNNPQDYWRTLSARNAPPIFYTPHHGGHWILHEYEDTLEGYRDTDFFTNFPNGIPARQGGAAKLIPVEIDPPEHVKYRNILAPAFSPVEVRKMRDQIRARITELIERFQQSGQCDFAEQIAGQLPTSVFISMIGMNVAELPEIMRLEHAFLRGATIEERIAGADGIQDYVVKFIDGQYDHPGDNIAGVMLRARDADGQPWSREELYNTTFLLYVAGLDTVTNMMAFIWHRLATDAAARAYVAENIGNVEGFVDELMRLSVPAVNARRVRADGIWRNVFMKAGDAVLCVPFAANRDAAMFPNPDALDWTRKNSRQQVSFGAGPHRCVGAHLARAEIVITLEEWFRRIPEFALAPDAALHPYLGNITGFASLPLTWRV